MRHPGETYRYDPLDGDVNAENSTISNEHIPIFKPEILSFEYPISREQYNTIKLNPYGTIVVDGENNYLSEIIYKPLTGLAEFKLIPTI